MTRIAVVGSMNIDYFTRVRAFPQPGETAMADRLEIRFGGKGANQAVAASRLGASVEMIACLGGDEMGERYMRRMQEFGIGCGGVRLADGVASGSAFITLDENAENTIVVAPGANLEVGVQQIDANAERIADADCLLLQNEISTEANSAAMAVARESGTRLFYNPAPWRDRSPPPESPNECVIVNEVEAAMLRGCPVTSVDQLAGEAGIVVTRGADATLANLDGQLIELAPPRIVPVDTVGAGDTFVGALAALTAGGGGDPAAAVRLANAAAALSTQRRGAQEGMPTAAELARYDEGA